MSNREVGFFVEMPVYRLAEDLTFDYHSPAALRELILLIDAGIADADFTRDLISELQKSIEGEE